MSYCDYNPKLFREFTSMKTKVQPKLSTTWKLKAQSYNINESCILCNSEGVSIADISIKRLLDFMKQEKITMIGDEIVGNYIIGNDRSLYTEEMYNTWKEKFDTRVSTEISKKDLIPYHLYKTVCGSTMLYLGKRYTITATPTNDNSDTMKLSKGSWEYYCVPYFNPDNKYIRIARINQKAIEDLGEYKSERYTNWEKKVYEDDTSLTTMTVVYLGTETLDLSNAKLSFVKLKNFDSSQYSPGKVAQLKDSDVLNALTFRGRGWSSYSREEETYVSRVPILLDTVNRVIRNAMYFNRINGSHQSAITMKPSVFYERYDKGYFVLTKTTNESDS